MKLETIPLLLVQAEWWCRLRLNEKNISRIKTVRKKSSKFGCMWIGSCVMSKRVCQVFPNPADMLSSRSLNGIHRLCPCCVWLSISLSVKLAVCLSVKLTVCLSVCLQVWDSVRGHRGREQTGPWPAPQDRRQEAGGESQAHRPPQTHWQMCVYYHSASYMRSVLVSVTLLWARPPIHSISIHSIYYIDVWSEFVVNETWQAHKHWNFEY